MKIEIKSGPLKSLLYVFVEARDKIYTFKKYWLSFVDCKSDKLVVEIWKTSMMEIRQWKPLISTPQRHSHFGVFWPLPLSLNVYVIYYISHYVPSPNLFHLISHHTSHFKRECMGPTCGAVNAMTWGWSSPWDVIDTQQCYVLLRRYKIKKENHTMNIFIMLLKIPCKEDFWWA